MDIQRPLSLLRTNVSQNSRPTKILFRGLPNAKRNQRYNLILSTQNDSTSVEHNSKTLVQNNFNTRPKFYFLSKRHFSVYASLSSLFRRRPSFVSLRLPIDRTRAHKCIDKRSQDINRWNRLERFVTCVKIRIRFPRQVRIFQNIPLTRSYDTDKAHYVTTIWRKRKIVAFEQLHADK